MTVMTLLFPSGYCHVIKIAMVTLLQKCDVIDNVRKNNVNFH